MGLTMTRLDDLDAVVVSKTAPGFDTECVRGLRALVHEARLGRLGRLKFMVFDFGHGAPAGTAAGEAFDALVLEVSNLIMEAPIVSVAHVRGPMAGADLEFAMGCSMLVAEEGAAFSFDADPIVALNLYGVLAQKIGFVRAERLMEGGETLDAGQMHDMLLAKEVLPVGGGLDGVRTFLTRAIRRHNASWGIYRAQRIAADARRTQVA